MHSSPLYPRSVDFQWGTTTVKGVNIGGWLVLEPWITPTIFNNFNDGVVDEWTLCEKHPNEASSILQKHWDSWLKKEDLQTIYSAGFNMIRIPVGCAYLDSADCLEHSLTRRRLGFPEIQRPLYSGRSWISRQGDRLGRRNWVESCD